MRVSSDMLHISNEPRTDAGEVAEPEQQTVSRVITTGAETSGSVDGSLGQIPAQIVAQSTVEDFVRAAAHPCCTCRHWSNPEWQAFARKADHPTAPRGMREDMNKIRGGLISTFNASLPGAAVDEAGEIDVEVALFSLGFCHALKDISGQDTITHPQATCPDEIRSPSAPNGAWAPASNEAEAAGIAAYDRIMRQAAGKTR